MRLIEKAENSDIKVLVFPQLCVTSSTCGDLFFSDSLIKNAKKSADEIVNFTSGKDILIFFGVPEIRYDGKLRNVAITAKNGTIIERYFKQNITNYESRYFVSEEKESRIIEAKFEHFNYNLRIAAEISEDLFTISPPSNQYARQGATLIVNLASENELIGKPSKRRDFTRVQSAKCICGYIYASSGKGESTTDSVHSGHSFIYENGTKLCENLPFADDDLIVSEIDVNKLMSERAKNALFNTSPCNRENINFNIVETSLTRKIQKNPFISNKNKLKENYELILNIQTEGLLKRASHIRAKSLVIGLSGGLDSTLVYLICLKVKEKLPEIKIDAITMPCFGTTARTKNNALKLTESIGSNCRIIDITNSVRQHFIDIGHDENNHNVVYENAQARERTQVLMDIANSNNGLVVGTGDMSEYALGWTTYSGDHISMYGVNGGIPKTLVRHLISHIAETTDNLQLAETLRDIVATPVSPELLPPDKDGKISQKTEDILGNYDYHDFFLYYFIRYGFSAEKILYLASYAFEKPQYEIKPALELFIKRFFNSQFKRSCVPDMPSVGSVSLSPRSSWYMPSDAENIAFLLNE